MKKSSKKHVKASQSPGTLYYLLGASGVGKDSLMHEICRQADKRDKFVIAPRLVTRRSTSSDHDVGLSQQAFEHQQATNRFVFSWQAHDVHYAIAKDILMQLGQGISILVNGSRAYAAQAKKIYPAMVLVGIDADQSTLKARLKQRGREKEKEIEARLARNERYQNTLILSDVIIRNQQTIESVAAHFLSLVHAGKLVASA